MNEPTPYVSLTNVPKAERRRLPPPQRVLEEPDYRAGMIEVAKQMAGSGVAVPAHLRDNVGACFSVILNSATWGLNYYAVAQCTYQPAGERSNVAYYGRLVHAIIEASGRLEPGTGGVHYEHYGDWSQIEGNFVIKESSRVNENGEKRKYASPTWTDDAARKGGCGVKVFATLRGEKEPRSFDFDLIQAQPRNSTLWATDPKTQLCYTAIRRFGNLIVPALLMGVPFGEDNEAPTIQPERDITPEGARVEQPKQKPPETLESKVREAKQEPKPAPPPTPTPAPADKPGVRATPEQLRLIGIKMQHATVTDAELHEHFGFVSANVPLQEVNRVLKWLDDPAGE